jgi:UDP-N-acetylglucosamine 4,6-dehydratase/5-epimerase
VQDFREKTILITGGTGSFGNELLKSLLRTEFKEVRIFSRDELKQEMMRISLQNPKVRFYIGDVRDRESVDAAMGGVDLIFHAAALKQVPSCEFFPMQAVMTNIVGSHNVIESAVAHRVPRLVCLGTDKAVYPVNAMGMTKALMEKVAQSVARRNDTADTVISTVRYGNVMCSRGSVIPLFISQIKAGKPLTITVPEMTRFLMKLSEAIDLVLFSFRHARAGDILIRKAPASTIADLAEALQQLFNRHVGINVIGMRHGEKLYESLASREELARAEDMGDYYRVPIDDRDLNYEKYFTKGDSGEASLENYSSHNTTQLDVEQIKDLLLTLPEVRAELDA